MSVRGNTGGKHSVTRGLVQAVEGQLVTAMAGSRACAFLNHLNVHCKLKKGWHFRETWGMAFTVRLQLSVDRAFCEYSERCDGRRVRTMCSDPQSFAPSVCLSHLA